MRQQAFPIPEIAFLSANLALISAILGLVAGILSTTGYSLGIAASVIGKYVYYILICSLSESDSMTHILVIRICFTMTLSLCTSHSVTVTNSCKLRSTTGR